MQAKANFKVTKWDQTAISDVGAGPEWGRATVLKTFGGELEGESRAELLLAGAPEGGAGYIAQERFIGRLGDRTGTFDTGAAARARRRRAARRQHTASVWLCHPQLRHGRVEGTGRHGALPPRRGRRGVTLDYEFAPIA